MSLRETQTGTTARKELVGHLELCLAKAHSVHRLAQR